MRYFSLISLAYAELDGKEHNGANLLSMAEEKRNGVTAKVSSVGDVHQRCRDNG